ncbi:MAG: UDP-N-acetylmuramoyl-L-alanine--D-glutamate ligase [Candidatus Eisenbacteria bacterium]|nr:UDP-N-acetylmuramoyl-L-alanine--D-glutamate ligase [Candidatus Latescibacterota bacterium]MBD3302891.1 UDP-N-acetylmuramoyl-L-alanine--D-glutamate ligase [Candidatus Eisenbacteria bacterium]
MRTAGGIREGERIAVVGMARSGFGAVRLALRENARPIGLDLRRPGERDEQIRALESRGARFVWGPHPIDLLDEVDRVVKSPGVPSTIPFLVAARERGLAIVSEVELAASVAERPILAITGTNGKSTTTAWAADMVRRGGRAAEPVGNIGRSLSEGVLDAPPEAILVAEISSFQLEEIETFHPAGAALLNLTPDHLDRHADLSAYREAKMRIFSNQREADHAVLGEDEDLAEEVRRRFRPRIFRFRLADRGEEGSVLRDGRVLLRIGSTERTLCSDAEVALPGRHNRENALAALALVAPLGLAEEGLVESLRRFPGLPHRLERIETIESVDYVNDSKATNVDSLVIALAAFDARLILLAGGRGKGQDFAAAREPVRAHCRRVGLFGEAAETIRSAWGADRCERFPDLEEAFLWARATARPGEIVLLSPACASFDQFRDFEERGDRFRRLVRDAAEGKERR